MYLCAKKTILNKQMPSYIIFRPVRPIHYILYIGTLFLLTSCGGNRSEGLSEVGDTLLFRHARNLTLVTYPDRTEVTMRNPWDTTTTLARYCFRHRKEQTPSNSPSMGRKPFPTEGEGLGRESGSLPLKKAGIFSSVHLALLHELGADSAVGGICDLEFCNLSHFKKAVAEGRIANLGNSIQPSLEQIIDLNPDALLPSPFENSGGLGRVEKLGIPIIWCADYMENTPLARAEWIRFYGRLFGRAEEADSIFRCVESRYQELCAIASTVKTRPRLLPEMPWSGQWTLPGSGSSSTRLYADAGAEYLFADLEGNGGIPLSTEKVVDKAVDADIWLIKHHGPLSRRQMNADTPLLAAIKAPIWWCDTSTTLLYEETPFHPERLLENLIAIIHPELNIQPQYKYFEKLNSL